MHILARWVIKHNWVNWWVVRRVEYTDWFQRIFLVERETGRNEHGVVVKWISACVVFNLSVFFVVVCNILIVRFSFGLLSIFVTTGWIFEISLCANSIKSINQWYAWIVCSVLNFPTKAWDQRSASPWKPCVADGLQPSRWPPGRHIGNFVHVKLCFGFIINL